MVRRSLFLLLAAAPLVGCQSATAPAPATTATASTPPSNSPTAPAATSPAPADEHKNTPAQPVAQNFNPPFPNRADLFEPPHNSAGVARREEEHGATVELKGFVNVDGQQGQQVVLAIDGVISPIPEGGEKYGVQVISIKPPSVILQRGRSRWTASLN